MRRKPLAFCIVLLGLASCAALADDAERLLRIDHYVPVASTAPAMPGQVAQLYVRELHADLGSTQKLLVELACSSHNAMWEKNRTLLFKASLDWLRDGSVNGTATGELKLGD